MYGDSPLEPGGAGALLAQRGEQVLVGLCGGPLVAHGPTGAGESRVLERRGGGRGRVVQRDRAAGVGESRARGRIAQRRERPLELRRVEPLRCEGNAQRRAAAARGFPAGGSATGRAATAPAPAHELLLRACAGPSRPMTLSPAAAARQRPSGAAKGRHREPVAPMVTSGSGNTTPQRSRAAPALRSARAPRTSRARRPRARAARAALVPGLDAERGTCRRAAERLAGGPHDAPGAVGPGAGQVGQRDDGGHGRAAGPAAGPLPAGGIHTTRRPASAAGAGSGPSTSTASAACRRRPRRSGAGSPARSRRRPAATARRAPPPRRRAPGRARPAAHGSTSSGSRSAARSSRVADPAPSATVERRSMRRGRRRGGRAGGPLGSPISSRRRRSCAGAAKLCSTCSRAAADRSR